MAGESENQPERRPGRKPKNGARAMTNAERQREYRERRKGSVAEARSSDSRKDLSAVAALSAIAQTWRPLNELEAALHALKKELPVQSMAGKGADEAMGWYQRISRLLWGVRYADQRHRFREGDRYVVFNERAPQEASRWLIQNPDPEPYLGPEKWRVMSE